MASKPGILTDWPWKSLGNYKYVILAPWVAHSIYAFTYAKDGSSRDLTNFGIFPFLLWRMLHDQIWITFSRYKTAKGTNRIVHKGVEFDQVDRERNWDDYILFTGILFYISNLIIPQASHLPLWRADGLFIMALLHTGPVEFLYYWFHRALHHHFLYSRYHSHHHSSIVTEPNSSVVHPFAEHIAYFILFSIPILGTISTGTASLLSVVAYLTYFDFMNNMGHCNFELIPKTLFSAFPILKYFFYTPSFHSLHHTQFRTNYSLFMPLYDYIYGTTDITTDQVYESSLKKLEDIPNVVHLTHLTTPESIYHLRLGFPSLASKPQNESKWFLWAMWPLTCWSVIITWLYGRTLVVERNRLQNLNLQTWALPKYNIQYCLQWQREPINSLIEDAILKGEEKGVKVISLGLLNQGEGLNKNGELYLQRRPTLKIKLVDGSSLAAAVVIHSIPKGTTRVLLTGSLSKVAYAIAIALRHKGIKVGVLDEIAHSNFYPNLNKRQNNLGLTRSDASSATIWLVGDGLSDEEQREAKKGTHFIPYSQFPLKKLRKDCFYHTTPAMMAPNTLENLDTCENWLERRMMSAWRVAGIVHALEGWNVNECGHNMFDIEKIWKASLQHGFRPLITSAKT